MQVQTAIAIIGQLVYKPSWEFSAEDNTKRYENSVRVNVQYTAPDSNRDKAALGYPDVIDGTPTIRPEGKARAAFTLLLDEVSDIDCLYYQITLVIQAIDLHEMREFLRVAPTYWAPFHPHHTDGMKRWAKFTGQTLEHVQACDLTFGLA